MHSLTEHGAADGGMKGKSLAASAGGVLISGQAQRATFDSAVAGNYDLSIVGGLPSSGSTTSMRDSEGGNGPSSFRLRRSSRLSSALRFFSISRFRFANVF